MAFNHEIDLHFVRERVALGVFAFSMFPLLFSMSTYLQKHSLPGCSWIFTATWMSEHLQLPRRGSMTMQRQGNEKLPSSCPFLLLLMLCIAPRSDCRGVLSKPIHTGWPLHVRLPLSLYICNSTQQSIKSSIITFISFQWSVMCLFFWFAMACRGAKLFRFIICNPHQLYAEFLDPPILVNNENFSIQSDRQIKLIWINLLRAISKRNTVSKHQCCSCPGWLFIQLICTSFQQCLNLWAGEVHVHFERLISLSVYVNKKRRSCSGSIPFSVLAKTSCCNVTPKNFTS